MATPTPVVQITLDKTAYAFGEPIVATFSVTGAGPESRTINGSADVDGVTLPATATYTLNHVVGPYALGDNFVQDEAQLHIWRGTAHD